MFCRKLYNLFRGRAMRTSLLFIVVMVSRPLALAFPLPWPSVYPLCRVCLRFQVAQGQR
jgi:hypothetical protein